MVLGCTLHWLIGLTPPPHNIASYGTRCVSRYVALMPEASVAVHGHIVALLRGRASARVATAAAVAAAFVAAHVHVALLFGNGSDHNFGADARSALAKLAPAASGGADWHLPHLVGEARAKGLAFTAEPITAQKAEDWGLIWKALPDESLMEEARGYARRFAEGPTLGFAETKACIHAAAANTLDAHLEREAVAMKRCGESADYAEGVSAFLGKRAPVFKGE